MKLDKIGTGLAFGGGILLAIGTTVGIPIKIGLALFGTGVFCLIMAGDEKPEEKKEAPVKKEYPEQKVHYKLVEGKVMMLDENDEILGIAESNEQPKRKRIGTNK
jgi:hypothetical protein